jgi:hypothetical protein
MSIEVYKLIASFLNVLGLVSIVKCGLRGIIQELVLITLAMVHTLNLKGLIKITY